MAKNGKKGAKYPIEYRLEPVKIDKGMNWIRLNLRNVGKEKLRDLDIKLNSLDSYGLAVYGTGENIDNLKTNKKETVSFKVFGKRSTKVYVTIDGWENGEVFSWESFYTRIRVGEEKAELIGIFALTEPYPPAGKTIRIEAVVRGLKESEGLNLEFWADSPRGEFKELDIFKTRKLKSGEESRYATELIPSEKGLYTIHGYLYEGNRQIGHKVDYVWVE